jgi:hypothetical protein
MSALLSEFCAYACAAGAGHDRRLSDAYGVPLPWLREGAARYGVVTASTDDRSWQPADVGRVLLVLPDTPLADPWNESGATPSDIIAFHPAEPGRWWSRTGNAPLLAPEEVERAAWFNEPLPVHRHPLDWLRAAGHGVVVLDWKACLSLWLAGPPRLIAADLALGEQLDRALNRPPPIHEIAVKAQHDNRRAA